MAETGKPYSNDRARNCLSPGFAASKSKLKLRGNSQDHIFSHFCLHFDGEKGRHRFPFRVWVGSCPISRLHTICPFPVPSPSPSRQLLPSLALQLPIPSRFSTPNRRSLSVFHQLYRIFVSHLAISVLGNHQALTGFIISPGSAHQARYSARAPVRSLAESHCHRPCMF